MWNERGGVRGFGGRSVGKLLGWITVISIMGERVWGSVKYWSVASSLAEIIIKKKGRFRLLWTRQKAEGKATTDIYYLLQSACGTGNGESCHGPSSESAQSCLQQHCFRKCLLCLHPRLCLLSTSECRKKPDIVPSNCLDIIDLKDFFFNYYKSRNPLCPDSR